MKVKTLERAMDFLACPKDRRSLKLKDASMRRRNIFAGYLACEECSAKYPIKNGVPCFYEGNDNAQKRRNAREAITALLKSIKAYDGETSVRELNDLTQMLIASGIESTRAGRVKSIAKLEKVIEAILSKEVLNEELLLLQAFNAARYNLEIYKGTFVFQEQILTGIKAPAQGIVVEAACATGENIRKVKRVFEKNGLTSQMYFGFDLSEKLVSKAAAQFGSEEDILFAQANMLCLPLKDQVASVYMANNVWDRVSSPKAAAAEAGRLLASEGAILLANCTPLQYSSPNGAIVYVPENERLGLKEAVRVAGCRVLSGIYGLVWNIETLLYGSEKLPMEIVIGIKNKKVIENDSSTNKRNINGHKGAGPEQRGA